MYNSFLSLRLTSYNSLGPICGRENLARPKARLSKGVHKWTNESALLPKWDRQGLVVLGEVKKTIIGNR